MQQITRRHVRCSLDDTQTAQLPPPEGSPVYHVDALADSGHSLHDILGRLFRRPHWIREDGQVSPHRKSYARRTGAERTFSTTKDPASNNIARGWTRLTGLTPITLWLACLLAVRNQRILTAWDARQADDARRAAAGLPPKTRRRPRKTLASLTAAAPP